MLSVFNLSSDSIYKFYRVSELQIYLIKKMYDDVNGK